MLNSMSVSSIAVGILFIALGCFWLLSNLGILSWSIWSFVEGFLQLWPMIFILLGVNIIFKDKKIIRIISWFLFFSIIITSGIYHEKTNRSLLTNVESVVLEKQPETRVALLDLDLGGGSVSIGSCDDNKLLTAHNLNPYITHGVNYKNTNETVEVTFKEKMHTPVRNGFQGYNYSFALNKNLIWDIDIDMGAFNGTFDFRELILNDVDIDMGAGKAKMFFGDLSEKTDVKIDTGASDLELNIPEDVGVSIKYDSALTGGNLASLNWEKVNSHYVSPNYNSAKQKIIFDIDMGVGKIDVIWQ